MATSPSIFPFAHIALTAAITAGVALLLLVVLRRRFTRLPLVDCLLVAVVVGLSVIVWRSAGTIIGHRKTIPFQPSVPIICLVPSGAIFSLAFMLPSLEHPSTTPA